MRAPRRERNEVVGVAGLMVECGDGRRASADEMRVMNVVLDMRRECVLA